VNGIFCPYCSKSIHFQSESTMAFLTSDEGDTDETGFGFAAGFCPACEEMILIYLEGEYYCSSNGYITNINLETATVQKIIYPQGRDQKELSEDIPKKYRGDYEEAAAVLPISAKASAALSRRCLQNILQNHLKIKKKNLALEIEEFIKTQQVPSIISEAVDAIRNIGNFAAHPLKETNTGEIIEVENGEAEWLLEVLDLLFDFYFVQPKKLEQRKRALNEKLVSLGKMEMK
jgi:hypothetical protein